MNHNHIFSTLSETARLWIYSTDIALSGDQKDRINSQLDLFLQNWQSHGRKVHGEAAILHDRFIIIGAEIPDADISGCGIDASVHALETIGQQSGFNILSGLLIFYRDPNGGIVHTNRSTFRKLVQSEDITADTIVFDPSLTHLKQFWEGNFELRAKDSWHATVFRIPSMTS